ncbi:MAG: manganese efflux pump MntP family protein, partial [Oscillospiraceae bacterium]
VGIYFGFFQGIMTFLVYFIGFGFKEKIVAVSHLIAFILLVFLGFKMIKDSFKIESYPSSEKNINFKFLQMIGLAIATSIDAMAVGISFAFLNVKIVPAAILIGVLTFFISMIGVKIGIKFGGKFKSKAEIAGGVILILIGIKIFLEHIFK